MQYLKVDAIYAVTDEDKLRDYLRSRMLDEGETEADIEEEFKLSRYPRVMFAVFAELPGLELLEASEKHDELPPTHIRKTSIDGYSVKFALTLPLPKKYVSTCEITIKYPHNDGMVRGTLEEVIKNGYIARDDGHKYHIATESIAAIKAWADALGYSEFQHE